MVLGFVLTGCATSIDSTKQKELINYGSIEVGMNIQDLIYMLGEKGQRLLYFDGKEKDMIGIIPKISGIYGWDQLGKNYFYVGEGKKNAKKRLSNYTLVLITRDVGEASKYTIDRMKEGRAKEKEIKDYNKFTKDYRYISWKKKWKLKTKKKEDIKNKEEEKKEKKQKIEEEKKKEEDQLIKEKKEKEEEKTEKKEADDNWF